MKKVFRRWICSRWGHVPYHEGMWGPESVVPMFAGYDGSGVFHFRVEVVCRRCKEQFAVAQFSSIRDIRGV